MCGDQSRRMATSDEDAMNDESDSAVDSVEAVGFSPRSWHADTFLLILALVIVLVISIVVVMYDSQWRI